MDGTTENKEKDMSTLNGFIKNSCTKLKYTITDEQKDEIINKLLEYYSENLWYGEGIMQDDDSLINAPEVLAEICDDILQFEEMD